MENELNTYSKGLNKYFKDIATIEVLSPDDEIELVKKAKSGDKEAYNELIEKNLKFVVSVAKNFRNYGVPFDELISEGNMGLIYAFNKFELTKGTKFITYAIFWIRSYIMDAITKWRKNYGDVEINEETRPFQWRDDLDDNRGLFIDKSIDERRENQELAKLLNCLSEREKKVVEMCYGMGENDEMTLDEVGDELHLTQERVRQIKENALIKLRCEALSKSEGECALLWEARNS